MRHARRLPQKGSVTVNRGHHDHGQPQAKASTNAALQESKLMINAVPPADFRSGMVLGLGAKVVGHQGGAVSRHVGARGVAGPLRGKLADVTGYPLWPRSSRARTTPDYIHRYINGHGRQATSSDPDRRMRSHPGRR